MSCARILYRMSRKKKDPVDAAPKRHGYLSLAAAVLATHPQFDAACRKRGFAVHTLMTHWKEIVGAQHAQWCMPLKYRAGTLHIKVDPMAALLLTHERPLLLERINRAVGSALNVDRLAFVQGDLPKSAPQGRAWRPLLPHTQQQLTTLTSVIKNSALQQALRTLGETLKA